MTKRKHFLIGLGFLLLGVLPLGYGIVYGQPFGANTIVETDAASGSAPALRASGVDANISVNIVPKGTGTVQVNGVAIPGVAGGGHVGPLLLRPVLVVADRHEHLVLSQ